jgi:hypothetical protein
MTEKRKQAPGWWAVDHNVGNDRRLYLIDERYVLSALGLYIAATGSAIAHETFIITDQELARHAIVGAASTKTVMKAAECLIEAGIWTRLEDGTIDCGAEEAIQAKLVRQKRSADGAKTRWENAAEKERQDASENEDSQETPF